MLVEDGLPNSDTNWFSFATCVATSIGPQVNCPENAPIVDEVD